MAKDSSRTITWEELGVDLLVVDEFNHYKNLFFATKMTRIAGLNNTDSQRAFDMFVKLRWLLAHGGKVIGMTGTPITNSIAEMYTMQRFFQMEVLEDLGLAHFDAWANQFALAEPGLEMTPDGAGFRMNTRFRKFVNVPELMKIWSQVVDTRRIDPESGIDRPGLYAGGPLEVVTAGSLDLKGYTDQLALRAERVRCGSVDPHTDNILKISSDGRKAALDMSLVAPAMPGAAMPKIDALVELVAQLYHASTPVRGTQAIFCDLATPKPKV
jgi:N12 class adenine-specific DNA methylase